MFTTCGVCHGEGKVFVHRPTTGPSQIEKCFNCQGNGQYINAGLFSITFQRSDELPKVRLTTRSE